MPITTVGDILDSIDRYERSVERFYAALRDRTCDDGVRLLTYHLARRKRHLAQGLGAFTESEVAEIRLQPIKVSAACIPDDTLPGIYSFEENGSGDDLLAAAISFTSTLLKLYETLVDLCTGKAHGLFRYLITIEQSALIELKKTQSLHYF